MAQTNGLVVEQGGEEEVVQGVFAPTDETDKSHDKIIRLIDQRYKRNYLFSQSGLTLELK